MAALVRIRYYGGGYSSTNAKRRCATCGGGGSSNKIRIASENIQYFTDNGTVKTQAFTIGREYYATEHEAEQLLQMTFVDMVGNKHNKFSKV